MAIKALSQEQLTRVQEIELEALIEFDRICTKHNIPYSLAEGTLLGAVRHKGFIPWDDDIDVALLREDYEKLEKILSDELPEKYFYQTKNTDKNWFRLYNKIRVNGTLFVEAAHSNIDIHHGVYIDVFPMDALPDDKAAKAKLLREFKFWNTVLSAKYINPASRHGTKRIAAYLLRFLFLPFSLDFLYEKTNAIATRYKIDDNSRVISFWGSEGERDSLSKEKAHSFCRLDFEGRSFCCFSSYDELLTSIYGDYMQLPPPEKRVTRHPIEQLEL